MKKQKRSLPKLIIVLLIVLLISTSLLGRTLARYITSGTLADDVVRVARWGVQVTGSGTMFSDSYSTDDLGYSGDYTVISANQDLVVAPGTGETSGNFTITGTPEVAARIELVDKGSSISGWDYDPDNTGTYYEPVVWTLEKYGEATPILSGGSLEDLIDELENLTIDVAPNTDLSTEGFDYTISWEWPFTGNDAGDTYYGDRATAPTITLAIDIVVTQID